MMTRCEYDICSVLSRAKIVKLADHACADRYLIMSTNLIMSAQFREKVRATLKNNHCPMYCRLYRDLKSWKYKEMLREYLTFLKSLKYNAVKRSVPSSVFSKVTISPQTRLGREIKQVQEVGWAGQNSEFIIPNREMCRRLDRSLSNVFRSQISLRFEFSLSVCSTIRILNDRVVTS
jgi:hypothetical protein